MSKLPLIVVSLALLSVFGVARASDVSGPALKACRAESDDSRRLACYDREIDRAQAAPLAELTAEEKFGRKGAMAREESDRKEQESRELGELQAKVTEIWTRSDGLMVVTLDNGQEWKQNRPDSFFRLKTGDIVKIQPASLGSFLMSGPSKRSTRVTRVR
jgi:hypothetical protein